MSYLVRDQDQKRQKIVACPIHEKKIKRIRIGWRVFGSQHNIMKSSFPLALKRKLYNQCILHVLSYESETWSLTKAME